MTGDNEFLEATGRQSFAAGLSIGLHACVLCLMLVNFSWASKEFEKAPAAILMVDLSKVEISNKTNLPPKAQEKKKEAPKPKVQEKKKEPPKPQPKKPEPKKQETKTPPVQKAPELKKEAPKPTPKPAPKEAAKVVEPKKAEPKKEIKKPEPKKPETQKNSPKKVESKPTPKPQPKAQPKQENADMKSLLANVAAVRKAPTPAPEEPANEQSDMDINDGIKGGTEGSRLQNISVSMTDYISSEITKSWYVDAGVKNAEKINIELKVYLDKGGTVTKVDNLYKGSDPAIKRMAESAVRAVWICDKKEPSPFKRLATEYKGSYSDWREIHLFMNPLGGVQF